jgi:Ca-activated chloride channel family protein
MFENPYFFWFFLLVPFIAFLFTLDIFITKKKSEKIAGENIPTILPYFSEGQKWIKVVFYLIGFCLFIIALSRPKWGIEKVESKINGRDILILLDASYSMETADEIPSRFELAKKAVSRLLEAETGDRIGLMVFSGDSELICPITHDYAAVNFFLESLYPGIIGKDGTNIGKGLKNSLEAFEDTDDKSRMIILITDGENLQGDIASSVEHFKDTGIKVFTIGVGTKNGEPIPLYTNGEKTGYVKDENDEPVMSKLDEESLKYIASKTNGLYLGRINSKDFILNSMKVINNVEKIEKDSMKYEQRKEKYDIFLMPALILFCLGFLLDQGRLFSLKYDKFKWLIER